MLDYKSRYKELRAKMLESTDVAYRLGYADGLKQAAADNAQMQIQQAQQQMMAMQGQGQQVDENGQPIQDPNAAGGEQQLGPDGQPMQDPNAAMGGGMPMNPNVMAMQGQPGEEMEQGAQTELDGYINELEELVSKGQKPTISDLRKTVSAITDLRKNQKNKVKVIKTKEVSAQKTMVDNILKKWEKESKLTGDNLEERIKEEGLKL